MCECQYCADRGEKECPLVQAGAQVASTALLDAPYSRQREALRNGIDGVEHCLADLRHAMNRGEWALAWDKWGAIGDLTRMIRK